MIGGLRAAALLSALQHATNMLRATFAAIRDRWQAYERREARGPH